MKKNNYGLWFLPGILLILSLLFFIFIENMYPARIEVEWANIFGKISLLVIAIIWLIVIQILSSEKWLYFALAIGFSLFYFGNLVDLFNEFYSIQSEFRELRNIGLSAGIASASIGFYLWSRSYAKARETLENEVNERTRELGRINQDLEAEILERKRAQKISEVFSNLGVKLSAVSTPKETAFVILEAADDMFTWDACGVYFYLEEENKYFSILHMDTIEGVRKECEVTQSVHSLGPVSKRALEEGPQLILRNSSHEAEVNGLVAFGDKSRISASLMFAPIKKKDKKVGVLTIQSYTPKKYNEQDLRLFQVLADYCSAALERTISETKFRQSEARYRLMVETSLSILWEADVESWQFNFISGQAEELLGYPLEDWYKPHFWMDHIHPQDRGKAVMKRRLWDKEGEDYSLEYRMIKADGKILWIMEQARILKAGDKSPLLIRGIFTDITTRKLADEALRESEARYRAVVEDQTEWICRFTPHGTLTFVNDAYARYWGRLPESMIGINFFKLNAKAGRKNLQKYLKNFTIEKPTQTMEIEVHTPDGKIQWQQWTDRALFDEQGEIAEYQSVGQDITQRKNAEEALIKSRDELEQIKLRDQAILKSTPHGLCLFDSNWTIQYANHSMNKILNPKSQMTQELIDLKLEALFDSNEDFVQYTKSAIQSIHRTGMDVRELQLTRLDKSPFWCEISIVRLDPSQTLAGYVATITDISMRKSVEAELERAALYDTLSSLPNRALFLDRLGRCHGRSKRKEEYQFAILYLDLDRFKTVNDSLGHMVGDQLLQDTARRLEQCVREGDTVARWGGDEFTIILDDIKSITDATRIADRMLKALSSPFYLQGVEFFTSASIGIALSATGYEEPQDLLRDADTAMYKAKDLGRDRYVVFDKTMHDTALTQLRLESGLRNALFHNEFIVHYQPIVEMDTASIIGFEALIRWQHPERGMIDPQTFISVAEDTGLIISIGEWVLREACQQLSRWESQFHLNGSLSMSVNISAKQYIHPSFYDMVSGVLEECELEGHKLCLEVTEGVTHGPLDNVKPIFQNLKNLGIQLHLDDFGTGYSSLGYLHNLPIDALKIDRSFIMNMDHITESQEIVRAIITLARTLNIIVIAEGVEKLRHQEILTSLECPLGQGNYFHAPMTEKEIRKLLPLMQTNAV
ncbi:EAL domain-containing protein [Candidatus Sumerlaeota bacterium]|nr:EAL domain-containing protein [Candidatus Sumerlaeota bacterium]